MSVEADGGWASQTLDRALWQSSVLGLASWQLVVGLFVASRAPELGSSLVVAHVLLAGSAVAAAFVLRNPVVRVAWLGALGALLTVDLTITTDELATTILCMTFVVSATPFLVLRPSLAAAVTVSGVGAAATLAVLYGQGGRVALAITVPAICYGVAASLLNAGLRRFAAATDAEDLRAMADQRGLRDARVAARTSAEYARTLHDTVINTLALIASGGRSSTDDAGVRRRCRENVASLDVLGPDPDRGARRPLVFSESLALSIEWTGFDEQERNLRIAALGDRRSAAVRGIVRELLLNVEKHAGTDRVAIDVGEIAGALTVKIADAGRGFTFDPVPGRGLVESVLRRAEEAGIEVEIATAPGKDTVACLTCPVGQDHLDTHRPSDSEVEKGAESIRRAGTWGWCIAVTAASLTSGAIGTGTVATYLCVALVGILCAAAWYACRGARPLPPWQALAIAIGTPVAFSLGFLGANFGGGDARFWQAIGLTPLLVVLLNLSRNRIHLVVACAGLVVAAGLAATATWQTDPVAAGVAIANACIQLAQLSVWLIFAKVLDSIAAHAAASRREADLAHADRAALDAAVTTQRLWRDAQVQTALHLLQEIAAGVASASDPEIRERAGREEHHLRQLLLLNPALVHLGPWLARSLGECHRRNVRASVRTGDVDLAGEEVARAVGSTLIDLLRRVDSDTDIVISRFSEDVSPGVTVVGPAGFINSRELTSINGESPDCKVRYTRLSSQELLELVPTAAT